MARSSKKARKMTPSQIRKRHEIAEAIHREDPDMPMAKKMKIATAKARKNKK